MLNLYIKKNTNLYLTVTTLIASIYAIGFIDTSLLSHKLFHDDSYYYFEIANNFIDTKNFTFDTINNTNGFHLLWLIVLIFFGLIFKALTNSYLDIAQIAILIQGIIFYLSFTSLKRAYSKNTSDNILIFGVHLMFLPFFMNGMETGLIILLFNLYLKKIFLLKEYSKSYLLIFLILLARYDSIIILFLILLLITFKKKNLTYFKQFILAFLVFLIVIVSFNFLIGIGFDNLSTSSSVKNYWYELEYQQHLNNCEIQNLNCSLFYVKNKIEFLPIYIANVNKLLFSIVQYTSAYNSFGEIPIRRIIPFLMVVFPICILNLTKNTKIRKFDINSLWFIAVIHLSFLSLTSIIWLVFDWYNYFIISLFLLTLIEVFINNKKLVKILFSVFVLINSYIYMSSPPSQWAKVYSDTANYLNSYENIVIGTWAAGHIGYYSDNPVINLEGLVGDTDIIEMNKKGTLDKYILNNLDFLVTNFDPYITPGDPKWFYELRINPLIKIKEKLDLVEIIKRDDETYTMYIFKINNNTKR